MSNFTLVDFPADVTTTVLLEVCAEQDAGCCVENTKSVKVLVFFADTTPTGNLTVSLETPDMQSQELGVTLGSDFSFRGNISPGVVLSGVWKLKFLASPDAAGFSGRFFEFGSFADQCV